MTNHKCIKFYCISELRTSFNFFKSYINIRYYLWKNRLISNPGPENLYHLLLKNIREKTPPTIAPVPAKTKKHVMYKTQV